MDIEQLNRIFLLGGADLEMQTIKEHLLAKGFKEGIDLFDKKLKWGATLSDYQEELEQFKTSTIYGIELSEDITPPKNYQRIDHHNELSDNPSSLEQVLKILEQKPTRRDKLIMTNDVGHIEAMKCMGATKEEIESIRQEERAIAGVTEEDEVQALKEIECVEEKKGIYIIETTLETFSPIVDNFEKRPLLLFGKNDLTYYGEIGFLKENYKEALEKNEAYHGRGYFGFDSKYVALQTAKKLLEEILEMKEEKALHSYHTFMFPFIFDKETIEEKLWNYKEFKVSTPKEYNEKNYFYKHVQDALYNKRERGNEKFISKYFEYKEKQGTFTITTCSKGTYKLELDGISLRIFNTGVAILAFNLKNNYYKELEDVLAINDFGRRIYPQFLGENFTKETKETFLAESITLSFEGKEPMVENFKAYEKENLKNDLELPCFIENLIGKSFEKIQYVIDDRMFVLSQYHNDVLIEKMKLYNAEKNEYCYENNDEWYQYLFIDGNGKNCQSKHMTKKLIHETTYDRWIELGTIFGVTRYSFVALTGSWFGENRLLPHMQTMYFQMFSLLLAYRATIIKFADEIQDVTQGVPDNISTGTSTLYKRYLDFLNQLYFKEITAQDQGIELYEKAVKIMKIEVYLKDLDNEISELHEYVEMIEEKERNQRLEKISELGAIVLPPTLLAGIYGTNIFDFNQTGESMTIGLISMLIVSGLGLGILKLKRISVKVALAFGIVSVMGASVFFIGDKVQSPKIEKIKSIKIKEKK